MTEERTIVVAYIVMYVIFSAVILMLSFDRLEDLKENVVVNILIFLIATAYWGLFLSMTLLVCAVCQMTDYTAKLITPETKPIKEVNKHV